MHRHTIFLIAVEANKLPRAQHRCGMLGSISDAMAHHK